MVLTELLNNHDEFVNDIVDAIPWWELDDEHRPLMTRYLDHGNRDEELVSFILQKNESLVAAGINHGHIKRGAKLHDVAKPFVTEGDATLWDRSELSEEDRRKIRNHPLAGHDAIVYAGAKKGLEVPQVVLDIVCMHHERLDGSGYPNHLTSDMIPAYVQLFSVVDFVVSMGEDHDIRPYREAGYTLVQTHTIMKRLADEGKLNREYVEEVFRLLSANDHMSNPQLEFLGTWE